MLKAISDRIIIKLENSETDKFFISEEKKFSNRGEVISVGERVRGVNAGDKVVFHTFDELPLPEEGLVVIRQKSLLGVYE